MAKKNIIHVTNSNALSLYLISIAKLYNKDKYDLMIGCYDKHGPVNDALTELGIQNFSFEIKNNFQYFYKCFKLYRLLKKNKTDILHLHTFFPSFFGLLMGRLAGVKKIVVTRHHADFHIMNNKKIHSFIDSYTAKRCDVLIAVSEWTKKVMVDHEHVDTNKVHVVVNGILPLAQDPNKGKEWIRKEFNIPSDSLVVSCISRLSPEKNLEIVLQLVSLLKKEGRKLTLLICGNGINNAYHSKLIAICKKENIEDSVQFLGFRNDVGDILKNSDLFVHPSLIESFGFAVLEAMSIGIPILVSNIPSIHEIAGNEVAYIYDPTSVQDLYAKFKEWEKDPAVKERIKKGIKRFEDNFTFNTMIAKYEALYEA